MVASASNVQNVPVEAQVENYLEQTKARTEQDLLSIGARVEENMAQKQAIRAAQAALDDLMRAARADPTADLTGKVAAIQDALDAAGVPQDAAIRKTLSQIPSASDKEAMAKWYASMSTGLGYEAQTRTDVGSQILLALQNTNSLYTRLGTLESNASSAYSKCKDNIVNNLRA